MGKIGIVTYYSAVNNGAFLQAYCLTKFLENKYDKKVYFIKSNIDYLENYKKTILKTKNPLKIIFNYKRYTSIKKNILQHFNFADTDDWYDLVVVGSDEMWNFNNKLYSEYNIASKLLCDRKISYAISMGDFDGQLSEIVCNEIKRFYKLSVRDINSKNILSKSGFENVELNIDPVFLSDIKADKIKNMKPFLLVYGRINNKNKINEIKKFSKNNGLQIISIDIYNEWAKNISSNSPFEFYGYISSAELVITNMFHGAMLSLKANKKFISILTTRRKKKIEYFSKKIGFEKYCIEDNICGDKFYEHLQYCYNNCLDYAYINSKIQEEIDKTINYFTF